jgi:hypothetical protein
MSHPNAVPVLLSKAQAILDDPELTAYDLQRLGTMFLSALVATCPTILLPDEYSRAREALRPESNATEDDLRTVARATLAALGKGEWNADQTWIVEVARK